MMASYGIAEWNNIPDRMSHIYRFPAHPFIKWLSRYFSIKPWAHAEYHGMKRVTPTPHSKG